jgi:hypothetical protein
MVRLRLRTVALVSAVIASMVAFASVGNAFAATQHPLTARQRTELKQVLPAAAKSTPASAQPQGYQGGIPPIFPPPGNEWTVGYCPESYGAIGWTGDDTCAFYDYTNTGDYFMVVLYGNGATPGFGEINGGSDSSPVWWV